MRKIIFIIVLCFLISFIITFIFRSLLPKWLLLIICFVADWITGNIIGSGDKL